MTQPSAPLLTIRLRENGPLVVQGPFRLLDHRGEELALPGDKPLVALCRCGQSAKKPFCDGTHKHCGFVGESPSSGPNSSAAHGDA
ncbi:MAG: CDGSH iron-sulfur domain-containing protein [Gemmataceae bacterium]